VGYVVVLHDPEGIEWFCKGMETLRTKNGDVACKEWRRCVQRMETLRATSLRRRCRMETDSEQMASRFVPRGRHDGATF
jgi:hypothetical protein